ncbi:MAG: sugar ABC transporter permease [Chloroflexi bacterium]|nr:sugar ABC transporter permease [Chloroflexota bacterium]
MQRTPPLQSIRRWLRKSLPFWLILPTIVVTLVVQVYPALYTAWLSFHERSPKGWEYVELENFERLFSAGIFAESVGHTVIFLVGYSALTLSLGFIIALLLKQTVALSGVYITLLFIPWIIADIIAGLVFRLLVAPEYGLFSGILGDPRLFPPSGVSVLTANRPAPWFGNFPFPPSPSMIFLILASAWRALPFVTLLILAALQTVPAEVIESARIDGASGWQVTRHITIPLIMPAMVVALFNLMLGGMNGVGMVFSLTRGGPGTTTYLLSYFLYVIGWQQLRFGRAAALAIMIAIVNWILIFLVLRTTRVNERSG